MSETTLVLPKETAQVLTELTGEARSNVALMLVLRDYARHKLTEIEEALRQYQEKYSMSFKDYKQIWESEDHEEHYTYGAEQDFLEWEALVTRRRRLRESLAWLP